MTMRIRAAWAAVVLGFGISLPVMAEPLGIELSSGLRLYPAFEMDLLFDTNFFNTPDEEKEVGGVLMRPGLLLVQRGTQATFQVGGFVELGRFDTHGRDNYEDSEVFARLEYRPGSRHRLMTRLARVDGHDPFGERRTQGFASENRKLDEYHENRGHFRYRFGSAQALLNAQYEFFYLSKEYDSNRAQGTRFLDFDRIEHRGTFFLNYSPKSALLLRVSERDIDYSTTPPPGFPTRSATERRALVGVEWFATAKTSGEFLIGVLERDPDEPGFRKVRGVDWDVTVDWSPRERSTFAIRTGRETDESFLLNASVINTKRYSISWEQQWTPLFSTKLAGFFLQHDFEAIGREDDYYIVGYDFKYVLSRSMQLVGGITYQERDSTIPVRNFDKGRVMFGFRYAP